MTFGGRSAGKKYHLDTSSKFECVFKGNEKIVERENIVHLTMVFASSFSYWFLFNALIDRQKMFQPNVHGGDVVGLIKQDETSLYCFKAHES